MKRMRCLQTLRFLLLLTSLVWICALPAISRPLQADVPASQVLVQSVVHSGARAWWDGSLVGTQVEKSTAFGAEGEPAEVLALRDGWAEGRYTSPPIRSPWSFVALGFGWAANTPGDSSVSFEIRTSPDGLIWSPWRTLWPSTEELGSGALNRADLLFCAPSDYAQYRATLRTSDGTARPQMKGAHLTFIDSRPGPTAAQLAASRAPQEGGTPRIIRRSEWGANESWMTWPPEYRPVQKVIIHHTVTDEGGADPAWVVRAIYAYHALPESQGGRGWGDIGYNYLVDHLGNIYEGRFGGEGVVGGHDFQYNWGSIGASLIGDYSTADVPGPMLNSLTDLLAWKCAAHGVDPLGSGYFIDRGLPNILAHRDTNGTTPTGTACPGDRAYALMPTIRTQTKAKLPALVALHITSPQEGETVRAVVEVTSSIPQGAVVTRVDYHVDGDEVHSDDGTSLLWKWSTLGVSDGPHDLRIVAHSLGGQAEDTVHVIVDNKPPSGWVLVPPWSNDVHVPFQLGGYEGAAWVQFSNGWVWEGEVMYQENHREGSGKVDSTGTAWLGRKGDKAGWWYGPYTCALPSPANYQVYFRAKTPDRTLEAKLATIDVSENGGRPIYAQRALYAEDLARSDTYEEFRLDLAYPANAVPCNDPLGRSPLEFRTYFRAVGDLYLDRVTVFGAPQSLASLLSWDVRPDEGPQTVTVRFLDDVGNIRDYTVTVRLDKTQPRWSSVERTTALVQDVLSGLNADSAQWSASADGGHTWGAWQPLHLAATPGITQSVRFAAPDGAGDVVRFRAQDLAGNVSISESELLWMPLAAK